MKAGWQTKAFAEVLEIRNGRNQRDVQVDDGPYPIYGSAGKVMGYATEYICEAGTTIIGRKGTIDNPIFVTTRFWNVDTAFGLTPKQCLDPKYLHYFCLGYDFTQHDRGTTLPSLVKTDLLQIFIPLPPLDEQQRIVAVLDKAFFAIATATANTQKNLTNARDLFDSHLQSIFADGGKDWSFRPFEACLQKIKYTQKVQRKDFKESGQFPIVSQEADFINGYWDNAEDVLRVRAPLVIFGDHTQVLKYIDFDFVLGADGVKLLLPIPALSAKFLLYFLKANPIKSIGYARHYRLLKELTVGFPALSEQSRITEHLDEFSEQIDQLEEVYESKLNALTELKQSILQKAFAGQLT